MNENQYVEAKLFYRMMMLYGLSIIAVLLVLTAVAMFAFPRLWSYTATRNVGPHARRTVVDARAEATARGYYMKADVDDAFVQYTQDTLNNQKDARKDFINACLHKFNSGRFNFPNAKVCFATVGAASG